MQPFDLERVGKTSSLLLAMVETNFLSSSEFKPGFFQWFLDYLPYWIKEKKYREEEVPLHITASYKGDFYGLLNHLKVPFKLHRFFLALNGYKKSSDYDGMQNTIRLTDQSLIEELVNIYNTKAE